MADIARDKAVEAVEEFLHDTFEAPVAMGEEWTADQADAIVEIVLEAAQPRGAVSLAEWLVSLDTPEGREERRTVTLTRIIERAQAVLAAERGR